MLHSTMHLQSGFWWPQLSFELNQATAAIKWLKGNKMSFEQVSERPIEEVKQLKSNHRLNCIEIASISCQVCKRTNHVTKMCFLNPMKPRNRLNVQLNVTKKIETKREHAEKDVTDSPNTNNTKDHSSRAAMTRVNWKPMKFKLLTE